MEPLRIAETSPHRSALMDLSLELARRSEGLRRSVAPGLADPLATIVRSMNCYYSNLIEGHDTHPVDIERALRGDYSRDPRKRDLQLEAKAHIDVQEWLDRGELGDRFATVDGLKEIHTRFCDQLPKDLLWISDPVTGERSQVVGGALRQRDVSVGRHLAISPGAVPRFLARFEEAYAKLGAMETLLCAAAAHHRFLWIHPFLDGNGRVARLMSHAALAHVLQTGGLWSIARGLARNVEAYKRHLSECDQTRRNDLDGRGNLSEESLVEFTQFFLLTAVDQIRFMESLLQPAALSRRVQTWVTAEISEGRLPPKSNLILAAVLQRGELARKDITSIVDTEERQARRISAALIARGVLTAATSRAPLRMNITAEFAEHWFPRLFP